MDNHSKGPIALVVNEISRFIFNDIAQTGWVVQDYSHYTTNLDKLMSLLVGKKHSAYLIDLATLQFSPEDVSDQLIYLQQTTEAPVIIFASGYRTDNSLIESLMLNGFEQFILSDELTKMREQLTDCLQGAKNAIELAEQERNEREYIENHINPLHKEIAFVGTVAGVGTTTQAIQVAMYLKSIGWSVCYFDCSTGRKMEKLPVCFQLPYMDKDNGYYQYQELDIYTNPLLITPNTRMAYDITIYDYGVLSGENMSSFLKKGVKVCVAGMKPWQLGSLRWATGLFRKEKVLYSFPLISIKERQLVATELSDLGTALYPATESEMFCVVKKNRKLYQELMKPLGIAEKRKKGALKT